MMHAVTFIGLIFVIFCIFYIYLKSLYYHQFNETINALLSRITINSPNESSILYFFICLVYSGLVANVIFE